MNYESFYGGRRGPAFIIVQAYPTIIDMIKEFQKGGECEVVNYDEYVLIDTRNKNDKDNGKVFRRGYDYSNDMGGAIYVGQIVGPSGPAPHLELKTIAEVEAIVDEPDLEYRRGNGEYSPTENLIPGQYEENGTIRYNDSIQWSYCSVRTNDNSDTTAYIGFKIPYTVIDYEASSVDPYYNRDNDTSDFSNINLTERLDTKEHPFYEKWHINIPKGIKGDTLKNFRITTANNVTEDYNDKSDDLIITEDKLRQVLVYDYYNYDTISNPTPQSLYLGDYNMIRDFDINDEGTVTIKYTHNDTDIYTNKFKWIDNISLNGTTGLFEINYNYGGNTTKYTNNLRWVNGLELAENGTITLKYTTGNDVILSQKMKWIIQVETLTDGTIVITYNDNTKENLSKVLKYISNISLSDTGEFRIKYNNGANDYVKNIIWPSSISLNAGEIEGTGNQKLKVTYNNGTTSDIGNPINYIMCTAISDDYRLLFLYSDPARRTEVINAGKNYTWDGRNDWEDMGCIKETNNGLLVGMNIDPTSISQTNTISGTINYLNTTYPIGLTDKDLKGKLVTVGTSENNKKFYAFDYNKENNSYKGWYYLGIINQTSTVVSTENDPDAQILVNNLPDGGIWFILEN